MDALLALTNSSSVAIITYLLALIEPLKLKIERLYLDREFFCVPVIRWLQALDIPFEMPVIIRGKHGGTRQLIRGRRAKFIYRPTDVDWFLAFINKLNLSFIQSYQLLPFSPKTVSQTTIF